jgi:6-phospho-5-dehydro-2-deoxy-D-gluconate aldolase
MTLMLDEARKKQYAVPQFNMNGLIWLESILKTAQKCRAPVIVGTTDKIVDQLGGFRLLVSNFNTMKEDLKVTVPAILHLDHGQTVDRCIEAIDAGYHSVMYDGSQLSIEDNIRNTKQVVDYAKKFGVIVEGEVGSVGGTEDGVYSEMQYANQEECLKLISEAGVTSLAPALGSVHGKYKGEPKLGFKEMEKLRQKTDIPFVLHGASGISDEELKKTIKFGHAKINYNTELNIAWSNALRKTLTDNKELYAPMVILEESKQALNKVVETVFKRTGAYQQA